MKEQNKLKDMNSPCIRETCLHGCSPFLGPPPDAPPTSAASFRFDFAVSATSSLNPNPAFTNHESLPSLHESLSNFTRAFPQFLETGQADLIRDREYHHLSSAEHVCLDYSIGHGLFSYSQQCILNSIPSSSSHPAVSCSGTTFFEISYRPVSLTAQLTRGGLESEVESMTRKRITRFMNLSEEDYVMVFASNQSSAFRIVADSYPFRSCGNLLTVYDHESEAVDSMIKVSRKRGAKVRSAEFSWPNLRIRSAKLRNMLVGKSSRKSTKKGLFVFPLLSRVTGSQYSYAWLGMAQENGWHVLLDASSFGPKDMDTLGLSIFKPDFLICSIYEVLGHNPSGFACLFVKRSSVPVLIQSSDPSPTVGIVSLVPSSALGLEEEPTPASPEIEFRALDHADELGLILINNRGRCLINWLVNALLCLRHPDPENYSHPLVRIYGPKVTFERGLAVAFNVFDWKGARVDPRLVQKLADRFNITLSHGFLRHVWFSDASKFDEGEEGVGGSGSGSGICVVTAAIGFLTNFEDVYRVWAFVSRFLDADFVEKERWRYTALNQQTIEV